MQRIEATVLIPGRGAPITDGVLILDGDTIAYAGPAADAPATPEAERVATAAVLPGLWDCHGHLMGTRNPDLAALPFEPVAVRGARCAGDLRAALDAGFTSVREVGGLGVELARGLADGSLTGPHVYAAGAILSTTGGHGDLHGLPLPFMRDLGRLAGELRLCDGVDDCVRAVREQLRRNARVIKVCASGGVMSEVDHPVHQQFTVAELRAMVEVAGMADRVVAAHCHGKPGIMAAVEAGVRTIEHGTYLNAEACDAMRESGVLLVATRTIVAELAENERLPGYARSKLAEVAVVHADAVALAYERGVRLAAGTDIAFSGMDLPDSWGRNGRELGLLVQAGLTPLEAIEAATANAPLTLGPQAPRTGLLAAGYDADVITMDVDPLADIATLAEPAHVTGVWLGGAQVKGRILGPVERR